MDNEDGKNQVAHKTPVEELERLVKVRKYQHCEAEYSKLANEPNTMPAVRDRYLRIAQLSRAGGHRTCRSESCEVSQYSGVGFIAPRDAGRVRAGR